jgi:hypothetical protein
MGNLSENRYQRYGWINYDRQEEEDYLRRRKKAQELDEIAETGMIRGKRKKFHKRLPKCLR